MDEQTLNAIRELKVLFDKMEDLSQVMRMQLKIWKRELRTSDVKAFDPQDESVKLTRIRTLSQERLRILKRAKVNKINDEEAAFSDGYVRGQADLAEEILDILDEE